MNLPTCTTIQAGRRANRRYDVIFLDPPFDSDILPKVLLMLGDRLTEEGLVYVETGQQFKTSSSWSVVKSAKAGQVHCQLLQFWNVGKE